MTPLGEPRIGYTEEGKLMPGFEDVHDEKYRLFNSDSDYTILNRQLSSDIPLQRVNLLTISPPSLFIFKNVFFFY